MDHRVFVFTVHKAASSGIHDVMRRVARKEGWPHYSPNAKTPNLVEPKAPGDPEFFQQVQDKTGLVGPVRMPVALPETAPGQDKFILHLRDPRDVLVSMFFSWAYSHPGVDDAYRAKLRNDGVDAVALNESPGLKTRYALYVQEYLSLPGAVLLRYEDFVQDRPRWMESFLKAAGVPGGMKRYQCIAKDNPAARINDEDKNRHIRKATPGDHRSKLTPETIRTLNTQWGDILDQLGYAR